MGGFFRAIKREVADVFISECREQEETLAESVNTGSWLQLGDGQQQIMLKGLGTRRNKKIGNTVYEVDRMEIKVDRLIVRN